MYQDEKSDPIYMRLDDSKIIGSQEVKPGIILHFSDKNQIVGIEMLRIIRHMPMANLKQMQSEVA